MIKRIGESKIISAIFGVSLAILIGGTGWAYNATKSIEGPIVIHFTNANGITQKGTYVDLLYIGITGIVIVAVNFMLALELEARRPFLAKIVAATTLFLSILLFISFAAIISVN